MTPLLQKTKNMNVEGGWMLTFTFYFMETAPEPLQLDKWSFIQWKIVDIPASFIWNIIFFDGAFG
jgi:hypothetical protein